MKVSLLCKFAEHFTKFLLMMMMIIMMMIMMMIMMIIMMMMIMMIMLMIRILADTFLLALPYDRNKLSYSFISQHRTINVFFLIHLFSKVLFINICSKKVKKKYNKGEPAYARILYFGPVVSLGFFFFSRFFYFPLLYINYHVVSD